MNLENIKKAALILAALYLCLRILGLIIPAVLSVIGFFIKIVFWAAIILFGYAVIATILEKKE